MDWRTIRSPVGISLHPQTSTQETPYNLTYETEAMIPVEVGEPTVRRQMYPKPPRVVIEKNSIEDVKCHAPQILL